MVILESVSSLVEKFEETFKENYNEVEKKKEGDALDLDLTTYLQLEELDMIACLSYSVKDVPIGYVVAFITNSPHTKELVATLDTIYVDKKFRGGRVALKLLTSLEACLEEKGVKKFYASFPLGREPERLLEVMQLKPLETTYVKTLEK